MYRFVETFRRFRHDERGVALILVTIMLPVIVGDAAPSNETGAPICGASGTPVPDRRILYGAIIDCQAMEASGLKFSGRLTDVPVRAFGSFFITEPIKVDKDIMVELVDITGRGGRGTLDNFLRDEAQLYR